MSEQAAEVVELILEPIPPDTVETIRAELLPRVRKRLQAAGREHLLDDGEIQIRIEETVPVDWYAISLLAISAVFTLTTELAVETYKAIVLPELKKWVKAKQKEKQSGQSQPAE